MILEHGTNQQFEYPRVSCGKSGTGFYAYFSRSSSMRKYYNQGEVMRFEVEDSQIIDLTTKTKYSHSKNYIENILGKKITKEIFQQSGHLLTSYINKLYPNAKGFINFHFGYGLPTSKEVIIFDIGIIKNISWA